MERRLADTGLGTLYERHAIYERIRAWCGGRAVRSALEGPIDGMAGMAGLHLLPVARRGASVTVVVETPEAAANVRAIYSRAGLADRLEVIESAEVPRGRSFDLVFSHAALHLAAAWRDYLWQIARSCERWLIVTVANRAGWGARLHSVLSALGRDRSVPPYAHEAADPALLEAELRSVGRILEAAWLDCPWWPDLFVEPGATLAIDLAHRVGLGGLARRPRIVHDAASFPFVADDLPPELSRALGRHPVFEDRPRWGRAFAHHLAYLVGRPAV